MKFKIGDRVIDTESPERGVGTVTQDTGPWGICVFFYEDPDPRWSKYGIIYDESDQKLLVLEEVWNSPLMKALR